MRGRKSLSQIEADWRKWFPGKVVCTAVGNEDPVGWRHYLSYSYTHTSYRFTLYQDTTLSDICCTWEWYCWQSIWVSPNAMMRYQTHYSSQIGVECMSRSIRSSSEKILEGMRNWMDQYSNTVVYIVNKIHWLQKIYSELQLLGPVLAKLREACLYQYRWIFGKVPNGLWPSPPRPFLGKM